MVHTSTITLARIAHYGFQFVRERIAAEGLLVDEDIDTIEFEFRRFLGLIAESEGPLAVIDPRVDAFWHTFILFTPQYSEFCASAYGFYVHHQPHTSATPVPAEALMNFVGAYRKRYGSLNEFWLEKLPPKIRSCIESGSMSLPSSFLWSGWTGRSG